MCGMQVTAENPFSKYANIGSLLQFTGVVHTLRQASLFLPMS